MDVTCLNATTFDSILANIDESPAIDLTGIEFIRPSGMVLLALLVDQIRKKGLPPIIYIPDLNVCSYLARAGFFCNNEGLNVEPPMDETLIKILESQRGRNPLLYELTRLNDIWQIPELLENFLVTLKSNMGYEEDDAFDLCIVTSEICQNCFDHNSEGVTSLAAMQAYGRSNNRFLELSVGDCGDGIKASLIKNPNIIDIDTDVDAIRRAILPGVSEHTDPTRGNGLNLLMDLVFKHKGSVDIRSGTGKLHIRMDKRKGWAFTVPSLPGAQITITLPTKEG